MNKSDRAERAALAKSTSTTTYHQQAQVDQIQWPTLSLAGASVSEPSWDACGDEHISGGFLNRCLVFDVGPRLVGPSRAYSLTWISLNPGLMKPSNGSLVATRPIRAQCRPCEADRTFSHGLRSESRAGLSGIRLNVRKLPEPEARLVHPHARACGADATTLARRSWSSERVDLALRMRLGFG